MFATLVQNALSKLEGPFSKSHLAQPCRKDNEDKALLIAASGNIYSLEGILGVGGLAVVYKARRYSDGMAVALKVANLQKSPEAKEFLRREAALLARLDHPHVVKLIESGESVDGDPFIAMEVLEGQTLEQLLLGQTCLDLSRVARICIQVAEAVQHAHECGVLHRDIKPSNIMLVKREGQEKAVVYDFGISLSVGEDGLAFDESSSGSLLYASPEQLQEQGSSYGTDVYQLALVMFEALTGRLPFEISVSGALAYRRGQGPLLLSNEELGEQKLQDSIRNVLEKALERNPEKRTGSMRQFIESLKIAILEPESWNWQARTV